ncbi:MAG: type IV conjugative transfer system protein TraV [Idiomarina sp.]|uniref:type IV conjugative transfer system lipoprotein TraV n=1 Tax=Idiomarina sp. TaxID=1874361 RepID=UPI000C391FCB|nr:type IV conjugative transfer system lipoprotein TraV [Idiomarina sp.]MBT42540.1 type IV conjugative transfer system protein TraV [Idiomarina sp.]
MKKQFLMIAGAFSVMTTLTGCVSAIGQEDFTCPNLKKGGVCGGPRDVYELTNNRVSLENLTDEELAAHRENSSRQASGPQGSVQYVEDDGSDNVVTYKPRDNTQQSPNNYQRPETMPQTRFNSGESDQFSKWPNAEEPLAPEPLAVLEPAKVMRVLIAAYTDATGYLHMPGYTFVEVTPRRWSYGEAANTRPSRVVPLQIDRKVRQQQQRNQQRSQGVDPLEVVNPMGNQ